MKEAAALFEADCTRQPYAPSHDRLVVSPETLARAADRVHQGREEAAADLRREGQRQRLILQAAAGAREGRRRDPDDRQGRARRSPGVEARKLPGLRLHVRAIVRDGSAAFVGSQSLRKLELDGRREVGVIVSDTAIAKKMQEVFEADWKKTLTSPIGRRPRERQAGKGQGQGEGERARTEPGDREG